MSIDLSSQFQEAIHLAKSGQQIEALTQFRRLLIQQPDNILGLMWLSGLTSDAYEGITALEKVLSLNPPSNIAQRAQQGLVALRVKATTPTPSLARVVKETSSITTTPTPSEPDSVLQARAVVWPFRKLNRPIGELLVT